MAIRSSRNPHIEVTGDTTTAVRALDQLDNSMSKLAGTVTVASGIIAAQITNKVIGSLVNGVNQIKSFAEQSTMLAARLETLKVSLELTGENAGYSAQQMGEFTQQLKDTGITTQVAQESLMRMIRAEIDLADATDLARMAQNAAVIAGEDSSATFNRMIYALQTGNRLLIDQLGLTFRHKEYQEKMAEQVGKTVDQLSEQEIMQARVNDLMEQGGLITGAYEAAMETAAKQAASLVRHQANVMEELGNMFQPLYIQKIQFMTELWKKLYKWLQDNQPALERIGKALGNLAESAKKLVVEGLDKVLDSLKNLLKPLAEFLELVGYLVTDLDSFQGILMVVHAALYAVLGVITVIVGRAVLGMLISLVIKLGLLLLSPLSLLLALAAVLGLVVAGMKMFNTIQEKTAKEGTEAITTSLKDQEEALERSLRQRGATETEVLEAIAQLRADHYKKESENAFTHGYDMVVQFAEGMASAIHWVIDQLIQLGNIIAHWLESLSPPRIAPNIDVWGANMIKSWAEGMLDYDFSGTLEKIGGSVRSGVARIAEGFSRLDLVFFTRLTGALEDFIRTMGQWGKIAEDKVVPAIQKMRKAVSDAIGALRVGDYEELDKIITKLANSFGGLSDTMQVYIRALFDSELAMARIQLAQSKINVVMQKYSALLRPLQRQLEGIHRAQAGLAAEEERTRLEEILSHHSTSVLEKKKARLALDALNIEQEMRDLEGQAADETESYEQEIDAAQLVLAANAERLGIIGEIVGLVSKENELYAEQAAILERIAAAAVAAATGGGGGGGIPDAPDLGDKWPADIRNLPEGAWPGDIEGEGPFGGITSAMVGLKTELNKIFTDLGTSFGELGTVWENVGTLFDEKILTPLKLAFADFWGDVEASFEEEGVIRTFVTTIPQLLYDGLKEAFPDAMSSADDLAGGAATALGVGLATIIVGGILKGFLVTGTGAPLAGALGGLLGGTAATGAAATAGGTAGAEVGTGLLFGLGKAVTGAGGAAGIAAALAPIALPLAVIALGIVGIGAAWALWGPAIEESWGMMFEDIPAAAKAADLSGFQAFQVAMMEIMVPGGAAGRLSDEFQAENLAEAALEEMRGVNESLMNLAATSENFSMMDAIAAGMAIRNDTDFVNDFVTIIGGELIKLEDPVQVEYLNHTEKMWAAIAAANEDAKPTAEELARIYHLPLTPAETLLADLELATPSTDELIGGLTGFLNDPAVGTGVRTGVTTAVADMMTIPESSPLIDTAVADSQASVGAYLALAMDMTDFDLMDYAETTGLPLADAAADMLKAIPDSSVWLSAKGETGDELRRQIAATLMINVDETSTEGKAIVDAYRTFGSLVLAGIIEGVEDTDELLAAIDRVTIGVLDSWNDGFGTQSPSTETAAIGEDIIAGFVEGLGDTEETIVTRIDEIATFVLDAWNKLMLDTNKVVTDSRLIISSSWRNLLSDAEIFFTDWIKEIDTKLEEIFGIDGLFQTWVNTNVTWFTDVGIPLIKQVGIDLADGFFLGLKSKEQLIYDWVYALIKNIKDQMETAGDVDSPSKVTMRIGEFLMLGLLTGMQSMEGQLLGAATNIMQGVTGAFAPDKLANFQAMQQEVAMRDFAMGNYGAVANARETKPQEGTKVYVTINDLNAMTMFLRYLEGMSNLETLGEFTR